MIHLHLLLTDSIVEDQEKRWHKCSFLLNGSPFFLKMLLIVFEKDLFTYLLNVTVFCLHLCMASWTCLVPAENGRGHCLPCNWSYRWLYANMWVLGTESKSSTRGTNAFNHWAIFLAPSYTLSDVFFIILYKVCMFLFFYYCFYILSNIGNGIFFIKQLFFKPLLHSL